MQLMEAPLNRRGAKDTARQSRNQMEKDRIMAGQNHTALPFKVLPAMIPSLLHMILSCYDSVCLVRLHNQSSQPAVSICVQIGDLLSIFCLQSHLEARCKAGASHVQGRSKAGASQVHARYMRGTCVVQASKRAGDLETIRCVGSVVAGHLNFLE
jgi:hypothetical protein